MLQHCVVESFASSGAELGYRRPILAVAEKVVELLLKALGCPLVGTDGTAVTAGGRAVRDP
jgi:hypothetical protein